MTSITVHLVPHGGATPVSLAAKPGQSLMEVAVAANLHGIEAECGGLLTCATCHVVVRAPWQAALPAPHADELAMLEFTAVPPQAGSRLSCQLVLTPALDGLTVDLPERQT